MSSDYSYNELMAMQEQALERVREMQRRADIAARDAQENLSADKRSEPPPISPPLPVPKIEKTAKRKPYPVDYLHEPHPEKENAPSVSGADADKALILALILFLSQEGADKMLIAALMYIMG
ncbi:MAG: hypothetical protein GX051_04395 [Clostridiales bacterium]|nr:hypothetical protein [Clostridiales bacterium]